MSHYKQRYLSLAMQQRTDWLMACIDNPGSRMVSLHVALLKIAVRRRLGRDSYRVVP